MEKTENMEKYVTALFWSYKGWPIELFGQFKGMDFPENPE